MTEKTGSREIGTFSRSIKNYKKFSNVISYYQPDLSSNRTVYMSCL